MKSVRVVDHLLINFIDGKEHSKIVHEISKWSTGTATCFSAANIRMALDFETRAFAVTLKA